MQYDEIRKFSGITPVRAGIALIVGAMLSSAGAAAQTLIVTNPDDAATVSGTVLISADISATTEPHSVSFSINKTKYLVDETPPWQYSWDTTAFPPGVYVIKVKAVKNGGGGGEMTREITVTVVEDATPPLVTITSPAAGGVLNGVVSVAASASDAEGVTRVDFYVDSTLISSDTTAPYGFDWDTNTVADGAHRIIARAYDAAGNVGVDDDTPVTVQQDTTPPTVNISSPATGDTLNGLVAVAATATDALGVARVDFYIDSTLVWTDTSAPYGFDWDSTTVADGSHRIIARAYDATGNVGVDDDTPLTIQQDMMPPVVSITAPTTGTNVSGTVTITADAGDDVAVDRVVFYIDGVPASTDDTPPYEYSWDASTVADGSHSVMVRAYDTTGNASTDNITLSTGFLAPPPDPATIAPELDATVATSLHDATAFLYTGVDAIQTGVSPGAIKRRSAAVVRGRVTDRDGSPIASATVRIHGHPELGETLTRVDGRYDLVVNGGGRVHLSYERAGYLPAQRTLQVPWQRSLRAPEVALVPLDGNVTTIDLAATTSWSVAPGTLEIDAAGPRLGMVMFPPGVTAQVELANGTYQPLSTVSVRVTEYTVGDRGLQAMPGALPATSGYTYAVELSVDEALAVGGKSVKFSEPVSYYVNNFLGFPAGETVPVGYYDRDAATWLAGNNGRVITVLSINGSLAELDIDGTGTAATPAQLAAIGISDGERAEVARHYSAGNSLWRVTLTHFTPWDCNWPYGPPDDAIEPPAPDPDAEPDEPDQECEDGSIIETQGQTLGQAVSVQGTPFRLQYRSNRAKDRLSKGQVRIRATGENVPASLVRVQLDFDVGGQQHKVTLAPNANQTYEFDWDGRDVYGRRMNGVQALGIRISYVYTGQLYTPSELPFSFARFSDTATITGSTTRNEVTLSRSVTTHVGMLQATTPGLGGWTVDVHHTYDPSSRILYRGDGSIRNTAATPAQISVAAGNGIVGNTGDGGPATSAQLGYIRHVAVAPDGAVYFTDYGYCIVRRIDPDGTISTFAGIPCDGGPRPPREAIEGGLAIDAAFSRLEGIDFDSKGQMYLSDDEVIWRIDTDGIVHRVAGQVGNYDASNIDGGSALDWTVSRLYDLSVGPDDSVYASDYWGANLRRIDANGTITKVAGIMNSYDDPYPEDGYDFPAQEGKPATKGHFDWPGSIDVDDQGRLYVGDISCLIRRVNADGKFETIAGVAPQWECGASNEPVQASGGAITDPYGFDFGPNGEIYYVDLVQRCIRVITPDGMLRNVAGVCGSWRKTADMVGVPGPASSAYLNAPWNATLAPNGDLYIAEPQSMIWKVSQAMPGLSEGDQLLASADGSEVYAFALDGRHLRTLHALTGAPIYSFSYNSSGILTSIVDGDGNQTTIERDAAGQPARIVSPDGLATTLSVDTNGYLATIANAAGETYSMNYTVGGLMTAFTSPLNRTSTIRYDADNGRLIEDTGAAGNTWNLARSEITDGFEIAMSTAMGRTKNNAVLRPIDGSRIHSNIDFSGRETRITYKPDGSTETVRPDGTTTTARVTGDKRFAMQAPTMESLTIGLPSGLTSQTTRTQTASTSNPIDPMSLVSLTDTTTTNGHVSVRHYDAATRTRTTTTPAGRQTTTTIDAQGRSTSRSQPGRADVDVTYDARGRLAQVTVGSGLEARLATVTYSPQGFIASSTNAVGETTVTSEHDLAGRPTQLILPGARIVDMDYDAQGHITTIKPPGGDTYTFAYNAAGDLSEATAPDVGGGVATTTYLYNLDRQIIRVDLPSADSIVFLYDSAGRITQVASPSRTVTTQYDPVTGQVASYSTGNETVDYTHDGVLLTSETWSGTVTGTVTRSHNSDLLVEAVYVAGTQFDYTYDNDRLMTGAGAMVLGRSAASGDLESKSLGSLTSSLAINAFGEVESRSVSTGTSAIIDDVYTSRDQQGRIAQRTESIEGAAARTFEYEYSSEGWLTQVSIDGAVSEQYGYDANGNRTTTTTAAGSVAATYDAQDRLTTHGATSFSYTANGHLASKSTATATTNYIYDLRGNLTEATLPDGTIVTYIIDPLGRRIATKVNSAVVQAFLYAGKLHPAAELDAAGNIISHFVYRQGRHVPEYMVKAGTTYQIVSDHAGSPRLVVDAATGAVAQELRYDAFGRVLLDTNPGFQPFGFAGGLYDSHTGFTRFGARDYDAQIGRFTGRDPIGFMGGDTNLYAYVGNDPVNYVDPRGTDREAGGQGTNTIGEGLLTAAAPAYAHVSNLQLLTRLLLDQDVPTSSLGSEIAQCLAGGGQCDFTGAMFPTCDMKGNTPDRKGNVLDGNRGLDDLLDQIEQSYRDATDDFFAWDPLGRSQGHINNFNRGRNLGTPYAADGP